MSVNLINMVKSQLGGETLNRISGLLGESPEKTQAAVNGAVPALLGGLLGNASSGNGATNMLSALTNLDDNLIGNVGNLLGNGQQSKSMMDTGGKLLSAVLGGNNVSGMTDAIAGFSGISKGSAGSLLGLLSPMLMGTLKRQLMGSGGLDIGNLTNMLMGQKSHIASALPAGLGQQLQSAGLGNLLGGALGNLEGMGKQVTGQVAGMGQNVAETGKQVTSQVSGLGQQAANMGKDAMGSAGNAVNQAGNTVRNAANNMPTPPRSGASPLRWIAPLAIVLVAGWFLLNRGNNAPSAIDSGNTDTMAETSTTDTSSADTSNANTTSTADTSSTGTNNSDTSSTTTNSTDTTTTESSTSTTETDRAQPTTQTATAGTSAAGTSTATTETTEASGEASSEGTGLLGSVEGVSQEVGTVFTDLTSIISGIKDAATAEAALPKLEELSEKVSDLSSAYTQLPATAKTGVASLITDNLTSLNEAVAEVSALPGVGTVIKPVL
ncbi:MAG: DUF937 domain-containing protein, partial [Trueperaceae bacterium]